MKKILIITGVPPLSSQEMEDSGIPLSDHLKATSVSEKTQLYIPIYTLGAVTIGTYMSHHGFEVTIRDYFLDALDVFDYNIIGISASLLNLTQLHEVARFVKLKNPSCHLIVGGPVSWSYPPKTILEQMKEVDFIVFKEGEETFFDLVNTILNQNDISNVPGIFYRENQTIIQTESRKPLNMETILPPEWGLLNLKTRAPLLLIETARGCAYNCAFCSETYFWGKPVRFKPVKAIIEEIGRNVEEFGITTFRIVDSCFTAPENRCIEICDAIYDRFISHGIKIKWSSFGRITNLSPRLLETIKQAGCVGLDVGMESGDASILKSMNKRYSRDDIIKAVRFAREIGLFIHCNAVIGFPGETRESIQRTIEILNESQPDTYHSMMLDLAPNTDLFNNPEKYHIQGSRLQWRHETMTSEIAQQELNEISKKVTGPCLFPGGEYFACMLTAFGYQTKEISSFFSTLANGKLSELQTSMLYKIVRQYPGNPNHN